MYSVGIHTVMCHYSTAITTEYGVPVTSTVYVVCSSAFHIIQSTVQVVGPRRVQPPILNKHVHILLLKGLT